MNCKVTKRFMNLYEIQMDDEAMELLERICIVAGETDIQIMRRCVLGTIALQCIIEKHNDIAILHKKRNRWYSLSNILELFRM